MSFRKHNNNRNNERRQAKKRAAEFKAALSKPGADKSKLRREYHADKRARKADRMTESKMRYDAFQRKFQTKKYNREKDKEGFDAGKHSDFMNKTGSFKQSKVDAYDDFMSNYGNYKRKPGSLSAKYG